MISFFYNQKNEKIMSCAIIPPQPMCKHEHTETHHWYFIERITKKCKECGKILFDSDW